MIELNKTYRSDAKSGCDGLPENFIDLIVTSPPYFNARPEYAFYKNYDEYLGQFRMWLEAFLRVLKPAGRMAINIPDGYGRSPWIPIYADVVKLVQYNFQIRGSIVWAKKSGGSKTSWGSFGNSSNPCLIDEHEMIIVAYKSDPKIGGSHIEASRFLELIHSVWSIKPETRKKILHPAPFPVELPKRIIELFSDQDSIILDPFMGSGTTGLAAKELGRKWIGFDIEQKYVNFSNSRVSQQEMF